MLEMLCRDTLLYNYVIKIINNKKLYYNYNYIIIKEYFMVEHSRTLKFNIIIADKFILHAHVYIY